jgi:serine/threonine protein kinase
MPSHIGKYEIRREIGRGGSGSVYEAYDAVVGRRVAIKLLHASGDPDTLTRFQQEATAAGNLRHKNIVTIYDFGEYEGAQFIVMEYLEGEDLQRIIQSGAPLDLLEKIQIMREVAEGLQYAHAKGVAHRDVKPANIKVQPDGSVKIMDFGTARLLREADTRITKTGFVLGTVRYMAPEQFTGANSGQMADISDIYAYGATYYELISGKAPFDAADTAALMYKILQEAPAPLSAVAPGCPPALEALVFHALEKDPTARYQSMQDVLLDSEAILQELGPRQATDLVEKSRKLLEAQHLEDAQECLRRALTLDARNTEARTLLAEVRRRRVIQKQAEPPSSTRSHVQPGTGGPPPAVVDAPPVPAAEPGEFTRLFQTVPSLQPAVPTAPESAVSKPPPEDATRLFAVPRLGAAPEQFLSSEELAPTDTVLTIANCADSAFLNAKAALDHFPFTIGRDSADWNLTFDPAISARHVEIDYREGGFFIRDLESSNGAFVNGRRLKPLRPEVLLFGARILLGTNTEIVFGSGVLKEIPDLCGTLVGNRFTLLEKLHSSSKSVLYLAQDENLPRKVAVKLLSPSLIRHAGYRDQFSREAQTASLLRHPRICQVLDYGELRLADPPGHRTLYVCMEFLPAGSLQSRLNRPDPFPLEQIATWLDMICDALAYVHEHGVVHSGLKPSAIVFDAGENPFLTDFAFATRSGDGLRQSVIGSPAFLAPEQWEGAEPVPVTDLYSLAVLFFWLIAGGLPFEGQEHFAVRNRNFLRGPMPVHEIAAQNGRPLVPDRISPVFQQALALKPSARFPSAPDFAAAFRSALVAPAPVRSRPPSVFVSYQRAESSLLADMVKKEIERETGYQVFVDAIQQDSSGQFPLKLRRKIEQCDAFICLLGRSTLASDWVKLEIQVAAEHAKPMIPVFQESYRQRNVRELEPHIQELLTFEGVKILDHQNLFVDAAIQSLIGLTRRSIEHPEPSVHAAQLPETVTEGLIGRLLAFAGRFFR